MYNSPLPKGKVFGRVTAGISLKRLFDLALSVLLLVAALPIFLVVSVLVYSRNPGPVLFSHKRIGRNGRTFDCYKFRTMVTSSETALAEHLSNDPVANREWETSRKLRKDPRILGRLGTFLRATALDELPQLWNIFIGDMSFVGPRPVTCEELSYYGRDVEEYLSVRPGLTGIWQIKRDATTTFAERVRMDIDYVRTRTFWVDLCIILMTPFAMVNSDATT